MRLDLYLVGKGYVESRSRAARLIEHGKITIDGRIAEKCSESVSEDTEHTVEIIENEKYVSRGGLKLEAAINAFNIVVNGLVCADVGASTGGFTDCLLQNGADKVYALDSGHGQLHPKILNNPKVISKEGFNARFMRSDDVDGGVDLTVMDVSFISQTYIIPSVAAITRENGMLVSLIKPQFEAGRASLGKNGIVKSDRDRKFAVQRVLLSASDNGFLPSGLIKSPIKGGDGNTEYLAAFKRVSETVGAEVIERLLKDIFK